MQNRRIFLAAGSAALAFTFAPRLRADETDDAKKAIQADYVMIDMGTKGGVMSPFFSVMAPDYTEIDKRGKARGMTLAERKLVAKKSYEMIRQSHIITTVRTTITKLVLKGNLATVNISIVGTIQVFPKDIPMDDTDQVVWIKRNGKWWLFRTDDRLHKSNTKPDKKP